MSRTRRTLAAPFVVTTALGACGPKIAANNPPPDEKPPPEQPPEVYDQNGNAIDGGANRPDVIVNPPPPGTLPDPPADGKGDVITRDDGTCWYIEKVECPPRATCNPPPPMQVNCPPAKK